MFHLKTRNKFWRISGSNRKETANRQFTFNQLSSIGGIALKIRAGPTPSIETAWCAALVGNGAPIVAMAGGGAEPIVLAVGSEGDNRLHAWRGTGDELAAPAETMRGLHHFQTLIATRDRVYVAADGTVYAFGF